jgi:hypothetical protein
MINFNFSINNPWSTRWRTLFCKHGLLWSANKAWEFNGYATHQIVELSLDIKIGPVDHPGIYAVIGLFGYAIELNLYDTRHWDYKNRG